MLLSNKEIGLSRKKLENKKTTRSERLAKIKIKKKLMK
jgi:hypothetical protein